MTPSLKENYIGPAHTFELPYVLGAMDTVNRAPGKAKPVDPCPQIAEARVDAKQKSSWSRYWFPATDPSGAADRSMAAQLAKTWNSFARTGNPNYGGTNLWPRYNLENDVMRYFSNDGEKTIAKVNRERVDCQLGFVRAFYGLK